MPYKLNKESEIKSDIELVISHINQNGYVIKGESLITKSSNAKKNIFNEVFTSLAEDFDNGIKKVKEEFTSLYLDKAIVNDGNVKGDTCDIEEPIPCNSADDLVTQFNTVKSIFVEPSTFAYFKISLSGGKIPIGRDQYRKELAAYILDYNRACKLWWEYDGEGKKFYKHRDFVFKSVSDVMPKVEAKNYEFEAAAVKQVRGSLAYDNTSLDDALAHIGKYVEAMRVPEEVDKFKNLDLQNNYRLIVSYVLMHWMWLVKRNLHDTPSTCEEIMMNIYGGQGCGKTTFVERLGGALEYFYAEGDIAKVMDTREAKLFVNKRIMFFDEFGGKSRLTGDEATAMKKLLTTDKIVIRLMGTTDHSIENRKFTGIAATNATISDIIKDESGARRYFEVITDTDYASNLHFDFDFMDKNVEILSDDKEAYVDIWKLVDDSIDGGYMSLDSSIREDIRKIQNTYTPKSSTLLFLTDDQFSYVNNHKFKTAKELKAKFSQEEWSRFAIADLYKRYSDWCKTNNLDHSKTRATFKRDLEELPILTTKQGNGVDNNGNKKYKTMWYLFTNNEHVDEGEEE